MMFPFITCILDKKKLHCHICHSFTEFEQVMIDCFRKYRKCNGVLRGKHTH